MSEDNAEMKKCITIISIFHFILVITIPMIINMINQPPPIHRTQIY